MLRKTSLLILWGIFLTIIAPIQANAVGRDGTPIGPPNAVTFDGSPTASDTTTTFTDIKWFLLSTGTEDGGSSVLGYNVTAYLATDTSTAISTCTAGPAATTCQLTGLNFARTYVARIYATNAIGNSPYTWSSAFTTNSQTQSVDISGMPATLLYSDPSFQLTATATSGLPVTWSSTTSSVCTVNATTGVVSIVGTGTCTIKATQNGAGSTYGSAEQSVSATVSPDIKAYAIGATSIQGTSAVLNGNVPYPGVSVSPTFCISTSDDSSSCVNPSGVTISDASPSTITSSAVTKFKSSTSGLTGGVTYYYWVQVVNSGTTYKSSTSSFTTQLLIPSLSYSGTTSIEIGNSVTGTATASGGSGTYDVLDVSGLPDGVTFTTSSTTIDISGTPTTAGTYSAVFTVTDSSGQKVDKTVTIVVSEKPAAPADTSTTTVTSTPTTTNNSGGSGGPSLPSQKISIPQFSSPSINGGPQQNLAATASSGLPVSYSSATPNVCTIDPVGIVTFIGIGECQVVFKQDGAGKWASTEEKIFIVVNPNLKIAVIEPTNLQSTTAILNARAFSSEANAKVEICLSKSADSLTCPPAYPAKLGPITPESLEPGTDQVISVEASNLAPGTDYYVWARISFSGLVVRAESRLIHTPVGPSIDVEGEESIDLGQKLNLSLTVNGGTAPYRNWSITGLPVGATSNISGSGGMISGTPTKVGIFTIRVRVQDARGLNAFITFNLIVKDPGANVQTVKNVMLQVISPTSSRVSWQLNPSFGKYQVALDQKTVCETTSNTCDIKQLLGPKASLAVTAITPAGNRSNPIAPTYIPPSKPITISLAHFTPSSAVVSAQDKLMLAKLATLLVNQGFTSIEVAGHTDNQGNDRTSAPLSLARAKATYKVLSQIFGKLPVSVAIVAKGSTSPIASNSSAAGKAANRRAEVMLK